MPSQFTCSRGKTYCASLPLCYFLTWPLQHWLFTPQSPPVFWKEGQKFFLSVTDKNDGNRFSQYWSNHMAHGRYRAFLRKVGVSLAVAFVCYAPAIAPSAFLYSVKNSEPAIRASAAELNYPSECGKQLNAAEPNHHNLMVGAENTGQLSDLRLARCTWKH
ncbi:hypothetical protein LIHA111178_13565 [Litorimonas haliclonae]